MQVSVPVLMEDKDESEKGDDDGNLNKIEIVHEAKRSDSIGGGNGRGNGEISANTNTSSGCGAKDHRTDRTRIHPQRREISNFLHSCPSFCSYTAPVPISVPAYMSIPRGGVIAPSVATRAFSQQSSDQSSDSFTLPSSSSKSIDNVSEELRSSADIASIISSFNSEFVVATAYNEGLRKIFGNVSALEVAVSLTRNAEIERRGHKKKRNLGESMLSEEDTTNTEVLNALPAFNFAKSCTRVIESMEKSAKKEEEFLFFLRVKSVVDENGFSLSGWQTLITLEGISELSTYTST